VQSTYGIELKEPEAMTGNSGTQSPMRSVGRLLTVTGPSKVVGLAPLKEGHACHPCPEVRCEGLRASSQLGGPLLWCAPTDHQGYRPLVASVYVCPLEGTGDDGLCPRLAWMAFQLCDALEGNLGRKPTICLLFALW
jgi:hypothetical protein